MFIKIGYFLTILRMLLLAENIGKNLMRENVRKQFVRFKSFLLSFVFKIRNITPLHPYFSYLLQQSRS